MKAFFSRNAWFFIPYLVLLVLGTYWVYTKDKGALVLFLDKNAIPFWDGFFTVITNIGDGLFALFICLILLWYKRRDFVLVSSTMVLTGLLSQFLKRVYFGPVPRPRGFFAEQFLLREIPGLDEHFVYSMPSGHTSAAFALFALLAFLADKKVAGLAALCGASIVGFSRIYLAQHFEADVMAGSAIGVSLATIAALLGTRLKGTYWNSAILNADKLKPLEPYALILILCSLLYLPFLGGVHLFDWDEINFAESAREMLVSNQYASVTVNFRAFWEKPPLFIWMQALSMKLFGVNEFAARFPNFLAGFFTLSLLYHTGKYFFNSKMGWLWVMCYLGAIFPHAYFKSGIIDPWFNLFIFSSLLAVVRASLDPPKSNYWFALSGFLIGMALLTKGPVALLILILCIMVVWLLRGFKFFFTFQNVLMFSVSFVLTASVWYGAEIYRNGFWFLEEFLKYQKELASQSVATHGQPWYYHPIVLLIGCFPASIIAMRSLFEGLTYTTQQKELRFWMGVLFWVTLILFSLVKTKIIHYSSLCWIPLSFISALVIYNLLSLRIQLRSVYAHALLVFGILMSIVFLGLPLLFIVPELKSWLIGITKDPFAAQGIIEAVPWSYWALLPGLVLLLLIAVVWQRLRTDGSSAGLRRSFIILFVGMAMVLQGFMYLVLPSVEAFTQRPAIEFLKQAATEEAYCETLNYKSYAQYFYGQAQPLADSSYYKAYKREHLHDYDHLPSRDRESMIFRDWLIHGQIDKPAYFITKVQFEETFSAIEELEKIGAKGGFVFYKRKVPLSATGTQLQPIDMLME